MWGLIVVFTCSVGDIQVEGVYLVFLSSFKDISRHIQSRDAESILRGKSLFSKQVLMRSFELNRS